MGTDLAVRARILIRRCGASQGAVPAGRSRLASLLGGQIIGGGHAAKRIDTLVAALSAEMSIRDLAQLDLAYAPPFGTLWDPIQIAANVALRKV